MRQLLYYNIGLIRSLDLVNNKQVDIVVDSGSTALLEDCSLRKSAQIFALSAKKGTQVHLLGTTREHIYADNLHDPSQSVSVFG